MASDGLNARLFAVPFVSLVFFLTPGCDDDDGVRPDAAVIDAAPDVPVDARPDVPVEVRPDVAVEAPVDVAVERPVDAPEVAVPPDAAREAALEVAMPDALPDGAP
jgi:hypothetical protein